MWFGISLKQRFSLSLKLKYYVKKHQLINLMDMVCNSAYLGDVVLFSVSSSSQQMNKHGIFLKDSFAELKYVFDV